jgi:hypothetical protein
MTLHNPTEEECKNVKFPNETEYIEFFKDTQKTLNLVYSLTEAKIATLSLSQLQLLCKVVLDNVDHPEISFLGLCVVYTGQNMKSPIFGDAATAALMRSASSAQVAGIALRVLAEVLKNFPEYPVNSALLMRVQGENRRLVFGLFRDHQDATVQFAFSTIFNSDDDVAIQQALIYLAKPDLDHADDCLSGICEVVFKKIKSKEIIAGFCTFFQNQQKYPDSFVSVLDKAFQCHFLSPLLIAGICLCGKRFIRVYPNRANDSVLRKIAAQGLQSDNVAVLKASVDLLLLLEKKDNPVPDPAGFLLRCTDLLKSYPSLVFDLLMRHADVIPPESVEIVCKEYLSVYLQPTSKFLNLQQKLIDRNPNLWPIVLHAIFSVLLLDQLSVSEVRAILKLLEDFLFFGASQGSARGKGDKLKLVKEVEIHGDRAVGAISILCSLMIKYESDDKLVLRISTLLYQFILLKSVRETVLNSDTVTAVLASKPDSFKDEIKSLLIDGVKPAERVDKQKVKPEPQDEAWDPTGLFGFWGTSEPPKADAIPTKLPKPAADLKDKKPDKLIAPKTKQTETEKAVKDAANWFDAGVAMLGGDNRKLEKIQKKQEKKREKEEIKRALEEEKKRIENERKAKELQQRKIAHAKAIVAARLKAQKEADAKKKGCVIQ